ncbi:MAG: hypothetical protein Q7S06_02805 [Nanoarchaeota archaeon]|nr:hypothetical protein [Nanoarchaeota archaeon]
MKEEVDKSVLKKINLKKLNYKFKDKPLVVGGIAMEYYGLRKTGEDIDLILSERDHKELIKKYKKKEDTWKKENKTKYKQKPEFVDLYGDKGVLIYEFEMWNKIGYDYDFLSQGAIEEKEVLIISIDKLLIMKALAMNKEKYLNDAKLIVKRILKEIY